MIARTLRHAKRGRQGLALSAGVVLVAVIAISRELAPPREKSSNQWATASQSLTVPRANPALVADVDVTAIITQDPFRVDRTEFVTEQASDDTADAIDVPDSIRLLGTIVDSAKGNAAVVSIGDGGVPRTFREGARIGDRTLRAVSPGSMVLVDPRGHEAVIRVPKPGER